MGVALAVHVGKQQVVDLWAGHADPARTRPWDGDTLVNLYSVGKAVTALCALRLVDAGALDISAPVARYWPEFAQAGKERVLVRQLLTHQAGLPAISAELPPGAGLPSEEGPTDAPTIATRSARRGRHDRTASAYRPGPRRSSVD